VDGKYVVKIGDFGLSRKINTNQYYSVSSEAKIPVKWSAVEILKQNNTKYTTAADVWSFAVVMWEIFEHGIEPFAWLSNQETFYAILEGQRLPQPKNCPDEVYTLMKECWSENPSSRPSFSEILSRLWKIKENITGVKEEPEKEEEKMTGRYNSVIELSPKTEMRVYSITPNQVLSSSERKSITGTTGDNTDVQEE